MPIRLPLGLPNVMCPYCLKKLTNEDLEMVCNVCGYKIKETRSDFIFRRIPNCNQPGCNGQAVNVRCLNCHAQLPSNILSYSKNLIFGIVGATGCGKTTFLTTMIHEIKNSESPWVLSHIDNQTRSSYEEKVNFIYYYRRPVTYTPLATAPQLWLIKDKLKRIGNNIPSYSLMIFDDGGNSDHITDSAGSYIKNSKSLIILIDSLSLPNIASSVSEDILNCSETVDQGEDMMDDLANYIRRKCNIPPIKQIDRDVAVVITKIDAFKEDFLGTTFMKESPHLKQKAFVKADADAVDMEIRDWFKRNNETALLNSIEINFNPQRVRFFGVSSYGEPPMDEVHLGEIRPHRVLDPLIWMLANEGIADTV